LISEAHEADKELPGPHGNPAKPVQNGHAIAGLVNSNANIGVEQKGQKEGASGEVAVAKNDWQVGTGGQVQESEDKPTIGNAKGTAITNMNLDESEPGNNNHNKKRGRWAAKRSRRAAHGGSTATASSVNSATRSATPVKDRAVTSLPPPSVTIVHGSKGTEANKASTARDHGGPQENVVDSIHSKAGLPKEFPAGYGN
jgi:hypothetical protein